MKRKIAREATEQIGDFGNSRLNTDGGMEAMDDQMQYPWQQAIMDAFLSAPVDAPAKIKIAEGTISDRLKEWPQMDSSERTALQDGQRALKVLISEIEAESEEIRLRLPQQPFLTHSKRAM